MSILTLARRFGRFGKDRRGVAAVEFALILPMMAVLYLGGFEVTEAVTINRKVTHATSVLGDLVAQSRALTANDVSNVFDAVTAIMNPYSVSPMTVVVSQVKIDSEQKARVEWSQARNRSAYGVNDVLDIAESIRQVGTYLIVAEVHYSHTPRFGAVLTGTFDFTDTFVLRPRQDVRVSCC